MTIRAFANSVRWLMTDQRRMISRLTAGGIGQPVTILVPEDPTNPRRNVRPVPREVFFTAHGGLIRHLLEERREELSAGNAYGFLSPYLGRRNVFALDGEDHRRVRREIMAAIRRGMVFDQTAARAMDRDLDRFLEPGEQQTIDLAREVSARVSLRAFFPGTASDVADDLLTEIIVAVRSVGGAALLFPQFLSKHRGRLARVRARKARILRFIHHRLHHGPERETYAGLVADRGIGTAADALLTLLISGYETTATSISWGLTDLARDPDRQSALRGDLARLSRQDLADYVARGDTGLAAFCDDLLRRHNAIPFIIRQVTQGFSYTAPDGAATRFSAGDYVVISIEDHHHAHPEMPILTFGGGPKGCPGRSAAVTEIRMMLALILRRARLVPTGRTRPEPMRNMVSAPPRCGAHLGVHVL